ncbi:unnamed protein product [Tuber aestivum]|uniref:VWFA domain-containing protein n=1 Tax=Tuber aestivum TaxID=59557 RepID=A0A292PVC8_9PEZI|nr:unnamed protein product [Tuber aestivum]
MEGVQSRAADLGSRTATDNDTHVQWLVAERSEMLQSGFVGMENVEFLTMWSGSVAQAFDEPDKIRRRVLDVCLRPLGIKLPTVVVMSGWSHTGEDMLEDMRDYMTRGQGTVKKVLILKWSLDTVAAVVSCELEVYEHVGDQPDGIKFAMRQKEGILPGPPSTRGVEIELGDVCSSKLPPGVDAKKVYSMSFRRLKGIARRFIDEDGFRPEGKEDVGGDSDEVDSDDSDEAVDSNNSLASGVCRCTMVGVNITSGRSNNQECSNENCNAKRLSIVIRLTLPEDFLNHAQSIIIRKKLGAFFKSARRFLKKLARRCAETGRRVCDDLGVADDQLPDLVKIALYDTVILCGTLLYIHPHTPLPGPQLLTIRIDDSGSMRADGRYDMMRKTVLKISDVCTGFRDEGISVKFLNFKGDGGYNEINDRKRLDQVISDVKPKGGTRLGTVLRDKIVEPLIIQKAKEKSLKRPVFVTIITDGEPSNEDRGQLGQTIRDCKRELDVLEGPGEGLYGGSAAAFQISLVGNSSNARSYVKELEEDPQIGPLVYCTKERLDVVRSKMTDPQYTSWLIQLLAGGIDHE